MSNLKKVLEGYDRLYSSGERSKINDIKLDLTNTQICSIIGKASGVIFGTAANKAEIITRQYLLMMFAGLDLNKQILSSIGSPDDKTVFILPATWRKIISSHGIRVSSIRSRIAWNYFLFKFLLAKALLLSRKLLQCLLQISGALKSDAKTVKGKYACFFSLSKNALPQPDEAGISHDIISWYIDWDGRNKEVTTIYHNVKGNDKMSWKGMQVDYLDSPFIASYTKEGLFNYALWCLKALGSSFLNFITGRWWNVLLIEEAIHAAAIKFQKPELLAEEYYFNNSGWVYRPLWTYEAEKKGAKIHFYFYSTNCETFASADRKTDFYYGYQTMNWPHYLVWDDYQARFVRDAVGMDANVSVVGPIWFSTSSKELPALPDSTIAVFDVQPMRDGFYKTLGLTFDYYIPKVCTQFIGDIFDTSKLLDLTMALKRKRDIGKNEHPAYRNFIKKIESSANFIAVDANISAIKLIEKSSIVISMPFTSTAILARELKKPSIFYDPLNMLQKNDPGAHGIPIISNIEELKQWILSNVVSTTSKINN